MFAPRNKLNKIAKMDDERSNENKENKMQNGGKAF
jgi:hypothetical protein